MSILTPPVAPTLQDNHEILDTLANRVSQCTQCKLAASRIQTVFYDGNPNARLMLIGEAPGQQEDEQGHPFVGRSGQLLTQMMASVGIDRKRDTYICNIVKCRPPGNRKPEADEMMACSGFLQAQLSIVQPAMILLVGSTAVQGILKIQQGITKIRGKWVDYLINTTGNQMTVAQAMPIFHPAYLLRNASMQENSPKWLTLQDLKAVSEKLKSLR
ncbi:MAG: uracil-DNA glycosylase [Cyanobacteria bacterium P01_H01_bin.74]